MFLAFSAQTCPHLIIKGTDHERERKEREREREKCFLKCLLVFRIQFLYVLLLLQLSLSFRWLRFFQPPLFSLSLDLLFSSPHCPWMITSICVHCFNTHVSNDNTKVSISSSPGLQICIPVASQACPLVFSKSTFKIQAHYFKPLSQLLTCSSCVPFIG